MAERRAKRPRICRGDDDYVPGNIVHIELNNFMTFNTLKFGPGPRFNLVIGPNGSGKSSIVCAIALGLGGEPQLLGRAASIGAYVKRGEESGYIKITLRGDTNADKLVIMRKIDTRNKSEWLFNGKVVPKKEILEIIQRFNIQVNNLTQFLPQDRVCEFAKLTPVKLLEETEKAIGDPQLPILHQTLIDKSGELTRFQKAVEGNVQSLSQLKALNAEQERDVERVRQRDELLKKVESMRKKLPWLKYDMKKGEYLEAKEQERDAKLKLDEAAKLLNGLKEPIEKRKQDKAAEDGKCKKLKDLLDGNAKKRTELMEMENQLAAQVRGKRVEMEELRKNEQSRQERISKAKEDLNAAEQQLANMPPYEPPKEIEGLGTQILELEAYAREKRYQKKEKDKILDRSKAALSHCVDRLREMENTNNKRLHALRNSGAEKIFDAYKWVKEHRNEFKQEVYGPVLVEVNVSNRAYADYLEGHVPYYIWKAFITQDSSDRDFLFRNLKTFDVVVINHVGGEGSHKEPFQLSEEMQALGICSRLDQVFDAPHAVREVLTGQFGLEYSYIGSKQTDEKADMVQNIGIMDLWTPQNHYRWSKSRYGSHISASVEAVDRSRLLSCNLDAGELERLKTRKLELEETISIEEASLKTLQSEIKELEDAGAKLHRQREDLVNEGRRQKRKLEELKSRVQQRKLKLHSMESEEDVDTLMTKIIQDAGNLNIQRFKCAIKKKNLFIEAVAYRKRFAEKNMVSIELEAKARRR